MSQVEHQELVMPSSPDDRQKVNAAIKEIVNALTRIKAEQEHKKAIVAKIHEDFGIPKKLITKAASTIFKEDLQKVLAENEDLETLLETLKMVPMSPSEYAD